LEEQYVYYIFIQYWEQEEQSDIALSTLKKFKVSLYKKTRTEVVHKNVTQGCNLIKRSDIFKIMQHKSGLM
jgi:hypothetical protein